MTARVDLHPLTGLCLCPEAAAHFPLVTKLATVITAGIPDQERVDNIHTAVE